MPEFDEQKIWHDFYQKNIDTINFRIDTKDIVHKEFEKFSNDLISGWFSYHILKVNSFWIDELAERARESNKKDYLSIITRKLSGETVITMGDYPLEYSVADEVIEEDPSLELLIECFNKLGYTKTAVFQHGVVRFM